ncbi:hypothetical protein ACI2K4_26255 [Micromonospora sp. NPDC050397]|uniref:hypothetical protein n=1 Tax=Micromonospora sp. NPDC050397 TaxID=3364279 RepID=UPI00384B4A79
MNPGGEQPYPGPTGQPGWGGPGTGYTYPVPVAGQPYPAGEPGQVAPTRNRAKPYVIAGAGLLALFVLVLGGLAVWDVVREDAGIVACESLAARSGSANQEQLTEAEYRELRDGFADSDLAALREHGTRTMDLVWQVTRMVDGDEVNVLPLLPELSDRALALQRACAAQGVVINLDVNE